MMDIYVSEKQSLAKIIAGVRGGSSPPVGVWGQSPQGFVFEFKQKASSPEGGLGAKPPRFWFLPEGRDVHE
ncbi:MAG: hypothetical protein HW380_1278 [Magnetococcales bacterium]|nr:hypothetical protein [Magnetococcales bacterium]